MTSNCADQPPSLDGSGRPKEKEPEEEEFTIDESFEDEFDKNQRVSMRPMSGNR